MVEPSESVSGNSGRMLGIIDALSSDILADAHIFRHHIPEGTHLFFL